MSGNSIRDTFFEECEELLEALVEGLASMEESPDDMEIINAVFRAVHSIKGGAGAFGLERQSVSPTPSRRCSTRSATRNSASTRS